MFNAVMAFDLGEDVNALREMVHRWAQDRVRPMAAEIDAKNAFPNELWQEMGELGLLGVTVPEEYGGAGMGYLAHVIAVEEIARASASVSLSYGAHSNLCVNQIKLNGSEEQKQKYLPGIASGALRLQSMAVTEPTTGTDTTKLKTTAVKKGDRYEINGQKVWISRIQHSDLMILLARTTPLKEVKKKSQGLSIFMVDLKEAIGNGMEVRPIANMPGHETNEVFFDNLEIPAENLIGTEGRGFYHILDGLNAERTLIAAECIGDGYWFVDKARAYAGDRVVFDRPIGQNQGVQFPIARSYVNIEAANLMRFEACRRFDAGLDCGAQANMAKLLASEASWEAANACIQTHGGFGFAREYDVERKFREARLYQVAPISTNLILSYVGEHILGMPRSF